MLSSLESTFYASTCTIQEATETRDDYGQPIPVWANVAGLVNLPCSFAPISPGSPVAAEVKRSDGTIVIATHHIALSGLYTSILPTMRAVVLAVNYDILAVEFDSHRAMTRLRCEIVT